MKFVQILIQMLVDSLVATAVLILSKKGPRYNAIATHGANVLIGGCTVNYSFRVRECKQIQAVEEREVLDLSFG